jgi:hypothetical protein
VGLHSGARVTSTLIPTHAGEGRYFLVDGEEARVAAEVGNAEPRSQLCTTLRRGEGGGPRVRTVEHLLSAMEALGVDNCRVEVSGGDEVRRRLICCHFVLAPNWQFVTGTYSCICIGVSCPCLIPRKLRLLQLVVFSIYVKLFKQ